MSRPEALRVLILEDDASLSAIVQEVLEERGHEVGVVGSLAAARERLAAVDFDVALLDLQLPDGSGLDILKEITRDGPSIEAIVLTGHADLRTAVEAMKLGAYDYLSKPSDTDELVLLVERAAEKGRLRRENTALRHRLQRLEPVRGLVTEDPVMKRVLLTLDRAAPSDLPILIQGETGTGKELLARAVHHKSPRAAFPFIPINCAALPENIVESELFGYEKGAFTGAVDRKIGLVEVASRGVLFLDEVGELSPALQSKLLRVLETKEFFRVGGTREVRADIRVVSATNRDLLEEIEAGRFREDLYYRLNGVTLSIPPLRERRGDIPLLARFFLDRSGGGRMLARDAIEALRRYSWPGNVRELEMVVQRAALLCPHPTLEAEDLPLETRPRSGSRASRTDLSLAEMEKQYVLAVLERHGGHRGKTAEALGVDPKTLFNKLRSWGQQSPDSGTTA